MATFEDTLEFARAHKGRLTERDVEILGLLSLGWGSEKIATHLFVTLATVKTHLSKIRRKLGLTGCSARFLALFYVHEVLPTDVVGRPFDTSKQAYVQPGEKHTEWMAMARDVRARLYASVTMTRRRREVTMLLAELECANADYSGLGKLMSPPVSYATISTHLRALMSGMTDGSVLKLGVVAALAPFTDDIPPRRDCNGRSRRNTRRDDRRDSSARRPTHHARV